jgi:hypothetical protein
VTLELPPDLQQAVEEAARKKGITPEALVISILREALGLPEVQPRTGG